MKRKQSRKSNKTIYLLAGALSVIGCILMVVFPELALSAADRGITLFLNSVLPSLLPFFICANFMIALGVPAVIGRYFEGLFRRVYRAPGASAFVFVISITSGYPMGAKLIGDMGRRGEISILDGKRMLAFCTTSGPLFMLGTVGASMLGQGGAGAVIALSHYGAALLNGLLFRFFLDRQDEREIDRKNVSVKYTSKTPNSLGGGLLEGFTHSILSSFQTLGVICGYIVLFTLLTDFLQFSGALNLLGAVYQKGIAKGILEMTVGAGSIAASAEISMTMKCALCAMIISFGGISIMAQSVSMLSDFNIGIWYYLKVKICHGLIAFGLALFLAPRLLGGSVAAVFFPSSADAVHTLGSAYGMLFSVKMLTVVLVLFLLTCMLQNAADRITGWREGWKRRGEQKKQKKETARGLKEDKKAAKGKEKKKKEKQRKRRKAETKEA